MAACLALPNPAGGIGVDRHALAPGTERRAAVIRESDRLEPVMRLIVAHAHDSTEAQGAGFCAQEEVLCHLDNLNDLRLSRLYSTIW